MVDATKAVADLLKERIAVIRVSNISQGNSTLSDRLGVQFSNTVLSNDVVDVSTSGDDTSAWFESGDNLGITLLGSGLDRNDGLTTFGESSTTHEVHLATDTGEDVLTDGVSNDLTGQVDFNGRVNGMDLGVASNEDRVVDVLHVKHSDKWIVVHEVVELLGAVQEGRDETVGIELLELIVHGTRLNEWENTVREQLGVNTEVDMVRKRSKHGIGDVADTHLEGRAIRNEARNVLTDLELDVSDGLRCDLVHGEVAVNNRIAGVDVNHTITVGARDLRVDDSNNVLGGLNCSKGAVNGETKRAVTVGVRGRDLNEGEVERDATTAEERRNL